jgi:transposase
VCVRNSAGDAVEEARRPTRGLGPWLDTQAPARVIIETCTEAFRLAGIVREHGHDVRVVAATLVCSLGVGTAWPEERPAGCPRLKRSLVPGRFPVRAHSDGEQPGGEAICVSREALVRMRTALVNRVRSYVRSRLRRPVRATPETLPGKVRGALLADADGLPAHLERMLMVLETLRGTDYGSGPGAQDPGAGQRPHAAVDDRTRGWVTAVQRR